MENQGTTKQFIQYMLSVFTPSAIRIKYSSPGNRLKLYYITFYTLMQSGRVSLYPFLNSNTLDVVRELVITTAENTILVSDDTKNRNVAINTKYMGVDVDLCKASKKYKDIVKVTMTDNYLDYDTNISKLPLTILRNTWDDNPKSNTQQTPYTISKLLS